MLEKCIENDNSKAKVETFVRLIESQEKSIHITSSNLVQSHTKQKKKSVNSEMIMLKWVQVGFTKPIFFCSAGSFCYPPTVKLNGKAHVIRL